MITSTDTRVLSGAVRYDRGRVRHNAGRLRHIRVEHNGFVRERQRDASLLRQRHIVPAGGSGRRRRRCKHVELK